LFQLVLQFAPWSDRDFDDLVRLEDQLGAIVGSETIDGHDLGSNEANIFVITENPASVVQACLPMISEAHLLGKFSAGYRSIHEEEYSRLWPVGDPSPFSVK
jgi:hypothetical protein